jgi:hypothetical protein
VGISKRDSSDAQALAALQKADAALHERVRSGALTVSQARRAVRRRRERAELDAKARAAAADRAGEADGWLRRAMLNAMALLIDPVPVEVEVNAAATWGG